MSFSVAQSRMGVHTYPLPWAPQIRDSYTRVLRRGIAIFTALWLPIGAATGWTLTGNLLAENYTRWTFLPWWFPLVMSASLVLITAMTTRNAINPPLIKVLGYSRASNRTVSGRFPKPPSTVASLAYGAAGSSFALGWSIGAAVALAPTTSTTPTRTVLASAAATAVTVLIGWTGLRAVVRARHGWRHEMRRQSVAARVLADGTRVTGEVTAVRFTGDWLDQQPVFALKVRYPGVGGDRHIEFYYPDHPIWGPTLGNHFDVWFDPAAPDDPERVLLERRLVNETFDPEPQRLRRPASGGDGPGIGPLAPQWVAREPDTSPFRVRLRLYRAVVGSALTCALMLTATTLWFAEFGLSNWWELPALLTMTGLTGLNALWWMALASHANWINDTSWTTHTLGWIGFALMYPVLGVVIVRLIETLNRFDLNGLVFVVGGIVALTGISGVVIGGTELPIAALLNTGRPAPVDEIGEALRSSDPQALPRLEEKYGYRVGVLHAS